MKAHLREMLCSRDTFKVTQMRRGQPNTLIVPLLLFCLLYLCELGTSGGEEQFCWLAVQRKALVSTNPCALPGPVLW